MKNEITRLKELTLDRHLQETCDECAGYGELVDAIEIVPDWLIFDAYASVLFSPDDFFCGKEVTPA